MNKLTMTNTNSLERMEFEFDKQLPMTQRERLAMSEVKKLREQIEEMKASERKKTVAKDRSRDSGNS